MSAKTVRAPMCSMTSAVAVKVRGVVITSAPGPRSHARSARCNAAVPEDRLMQYLAPQKLANSLSKASTSSPRMKLELEMTRLIAWSISSLMERY